MNICAYVIVNKGKQVLLAVRLAKDLNEAEMERKEKEDKRRKSFM